MDHATLSLGSPQISEADKEADYDKIITLTQELEANILEAEIELATTNPTIH